MAKPDISIVVTLYKRPQYLASLMDSVFAQTLSNWELIFVDDGSDMPELTELCRRYEREDGRVRYICQENGGVSAARNRGVAEAAADYIVFVDDDDLIAPTHLQKKVEFLRNNPQVMMAHSYSVLLDENDNPIPEEQLPKISDSLLICPPQEKLAPIKIGSGAGGMCFCRKRLLEIGGWDADFRALNDDEMVLRILDKHAIAILPERLYICRRHGVGHLHLHPDYWKYAAAAYIAAYHRRSNIPEPAGARPFNLLPGLKHMPVDIVSVVTRKARSFAKRFLRQKQYENLAKLLDDFHVALSFDEKHRRKLHRNLLAWAVFYGKFSALLIIFRSISK